MKKMYAHCLTILFAFLFLFNQANAQNVNVNPGGGSYPNLKTAFDAINLGTHTGAVTVNIVANTTEIVPAILNASGLGLASYTSCVITPSAPVSVSGLIPGTAVIVLNGADNVTIDGRIGGTGRNLTVKNISNVSLSAGVFLSAIIPATVGDTNGCNNNIIRNLEISCGARQDSIVATVLTIGITAGGLTVGSASRNNSNNQFLDNRIVRVRYGIFLGGGVQFNLCQSNRISGNIIGPTSFGPDQIGKIGIYVNGQNNCEISCNTIQFVGGTLATVPGTGLTNGADRVAIGVGQENWSTTTTVVLPGQNYIVNANMIHDIVEEHEFSAVGIISANSPVILGGNTNDRISNNVLYDIRANGTSPDQGVGIGHIGGRGDLIVYNSLLLRGDIDPPGTTSATQNTIGVKVNAVVNDTNLTIRDNSLFVNITSNTASVLGYCMTIPTATYRWGLTGSCNYNDYYFDPANPQMRTGGIGNASPITTSFLTLANWKTAFTPAQDANSIQADPLYTLPPTTYPLIPMTGSPLLAAGVPIPSVLYDAYECISPEPRSLTTPTIGAWEYTEATLPVELASFSSSVTGRDVTLNWTTTSELNNSGFDIERKSIDNQNWSKIGNVAGNGTINGYSEYTFTDRGLSTGKFNYRLKQIDFNGNFAYYNLSNEVGVGIPTIYKLSQNYPNPFNPATQISYDLPVDGRVSLKIFDMTGREVATLVNEIQSAGYYSISYNASALSSGVYFYTISSNNFVATKKMMLVK